MHRVVCTWHLGFYRHFWDKLELKPGVQHLSRRYMDDPFVWVSARLDIAEGCLRAYL